MGVFCFFGCGGLCSACKTHSLWPFLIFFVCHIGVFCFFSVEAGYAQRAKPVAFGRS